MWHRVKPEVAGAVTAGMTVIDDRAELRDPDRLRGYAERCGLHGGWLPPPVDTCPDCVGGPGVGADDQAGSTAGTGGAPAAGPPPLIEYDPEAIATAVANARLTASGIETSVSARAAELATTTGSLRIVAALATTAAVSTERAGRLASEVSTMSADLGLTLDDYARIDDEVALVFTSLLTA